MATEELVTEQFQFLGIDLPKEVLTKCVSICEEYDVDAETFIEQWMAFSLTHLNGAPPTLENFELLARREFSKRAARPNARSNEKLTTTGTVLPVYGTKDSLQSENGVLSNYITTSPKNAARRSYQKEEVSCWCLMGINLVAQFASVTRSTLIECSRNKSSKEAPATEDTLLFFARIKTEESEEISSIAVINELCPATYAPNIDHMETFSSRTNQRTVVHSFGNDKLLNLLSKHNLGDNILELNIKQVPNDDGEIYTKAMFGFELLHEKASIIDNHISYVSQSIMKKLGFTELSSVRHKTQTEVLVAGRIECDADARLNPKSVILQGTWEESLSQSVPVDLDSVKQYSLFPGQVVVMRGINPRGDKFIAHEIYTDASRAISNPRIDMMNTLNGTVSLVIAAGPYTTSNNLSYAPFKELILYISEYKPHIVILMGPFLDCDHVKVKDNTMAETFKSFFDKLLDSLAEINSSSPFTKIYIVPSSKDAFHVNIYPTPPYTSRRKHPNIHFLPDPATINICGVIVSVTSVDTLMHISQEEISLGMGGDKLARLAGHVVRQTGFGARAADAALWAAHAQLTHTPHLLVLPSNFRYFVKDVDGCVVVNPEHLTKGTGGGTFARLLVSSDEDNPISIAAQILRI